MWSQFFIAFLIEAAFLFTPGYLLARALRLARPLALGAAPALSCAVVSLWGFIAWKAGIWADWASISLPVTAFCLTAFAASRLLLRKGESRRDLTGSDLLPERRSQAISLAAFSIASLAVCGFVLVKSLDGPASMFQAYDNLSHMMRIRAFVDTGMFSPIGADICYNLENNPYGTHTSGFYPSSWHCLAALSVSLLNVPVSLAVNATNALFASLATAIGAWSFLTVVLRGRCILPCAMLPLAFAAFPWGMIGFGPLYPNMAAFSMILGSAACFVAALCTNALPRMRAALVAAFFLCIMGLGLSHPNAVFGLGILLAPFICQKILEAGRFKREDGTRSPARWGFAALFAASAVLAWALAFNSSFMSGIVSFNWPAFLSKWQAVVNLALFSLRDTPAQLALSIMAACGILYSLRRRKYLWMTASFGIVAVMYLVNVSTDGTLKAWLTGFWYQDSYRICGLAAIAALPLASLGLTVIYQAIGRIVEWVSGHLSKPLSTRFASGLVTIAFITAIFCPAFSIPGASTVDTAFGYTRYLLSHQNDTSRTDVELSPEERSFLEKARELTGSQAVILNHPYDGSAFAAANHDLNVYWRTWGIYNNESDTQTSKTLRFGADRMAFDQNVQEALRETGAQYLLLLDQGTIADEPFMQYTVSYHPENWPGIESIDDETPGLDPILSEGDMRLYRITATEGE